MSIITWFGSNLTESLFFECFESYDLSLYNH